MSDKLIPSLPIQLENFDQLMPLNAVSLPLMKHEQLLLWAAEEWAQRYPLQRFIPVWADDECGNNLARQRIAPGRRLQGKARYVGYQMLPCPFALPINASYKPGRKVMFTDASGAFVFSFQGESGAFDVLYAAGHTQGSCGPTLVAIALVPSDHMETWSDFEAHCNRAVYQLERSEKVYIIGGRADSFKPTVVWDDVILSDALKADLRQDIETFFDKGVDLYRQLNLPPFRKLLLVGPPGTGKSTLCAALARLALDRKYVVIYVSSSKKDQNGEGNTFDKIQHALRIVANSQYPILLIVEELDAYLKPEDKSQILNVLDGFESPSNPHGALLIATTNYLEMIDERIAKRPGRIDRIITIPPIQDVEQAQRMLMRYMGSAWNDKHLGIVNQLVGKTGAFVREVALYARMMALNSVDVHVTLEMLRHSINNLNAQLSTNET